jgi:hypothetical protein
MIYSGGAADNLCFLGDPFHPFGISPHVEQVHERQYFVFIASS